jgi:hypothetical protein
MNNDWLSVCTCDVVLCSVRMQCLGKRVGTWCTHGVCELLPDLYNLMLPMDSNLTRSMPGSSIFYFEA